MNYYIVKAGQQLGPYSDDQVRTMLHQNSITLQDLFWRDGQAEWMPLAQWDGVFASVPHPARVGPAPTNSGTLIGFGYGCAALSLLFLPVIFAPAGIAIGIAVQKRGIQPHGPILIVASALAGIIGCMLSFAVNG